MAKSNPRADVFHALHAGPAILILPNAWDAASAKIIESAGAKAIATTSGGVAWSMGYADGSHLPVARLIEFCTRLCQITALPVTVDLEGGYSDNTEEVAEVAVKLMRAGVVGINLEDGASEPEMLRDKIIAVREAATACGVNLFINARTDVYLKAMAKGEEAVAMVSRRAALYFEAGANGLFVPGIARTEEITAIIKNIAPAPLNVMAVPNLLPGAGLERLGVRRLSAGTALAQGAMSVASEMAASFIQSGNSKELWSRSQVGYSEFNVMFG
jgi:2-methylisocitrate lyase-like PEP mutase family enzyme